MKKSKYDDRKLGIVVGVGFLIIMSLLLVMALGATTLPASAAYMFLAIVIIDCAVMIILVETVCKK